MDKTHRNKQVKQLIIRKSRKKKHVYIKQNKKILNPFKKSKIYKNREIKYKEGTNIY